MPKKPDSAFTGVLGEHFVAAYLSGYNLIVALPRIGSQNIDLLVSHPDSGRLIQIQVKSGADAKRLYKKQQSYEWRMSIPPQGFCNERTWYAFVYRNGWPTGSHTPEIFFVPSELVFNTVKKDNPNQASTWTSFFMYEPDIQKYQGAVGLSPILAFLQQTESDCPSL